MGIVVCAADTLTKEWTVLLFWQHYAACELLVNHKSVSLTEMCLISSCCCGFQELDHGLFIFAIFNILINFLMVGVGMYTGGGGKLLAFLILVDVALAVGAKLRVPKHHLLPLYHDHHQHSHHH